MKFQAKCKNTNQIFWWAILRVAIYNGVLIRLQFSASMWTAGDVQEIQQTARSIKPDIKLHAIPFGLQIERSPDAIVDHLLDQIPRMLL
jgi:hypothetical protein